jgi:hypothetical protein
MKLLLWVCILCVAFAKRVSKWTFKVIVMGITIKQMLAEIHAKGKFITINLLRL